MESGQTPPATPPDPHTVNAADALALAQAGGQAAANAPEGTDQATMKRIVREAIKEEADDRRIQDAKGIAEASAAATIAQLEARGAFNPPPATTPDPAAATPPAVANTPDTANASPPAPSAPSAPPQDSEPRKKTFAEKFLG